MFSWDIFLFFLRNLILSSIYAQLLLSVFVTTIWKSHFNAVVLPDLKMLQGLLSPATFLSYSSYVHPSHLTYFLNV